MLFATAFLTSATSIAMHFLGDASCAALQPRCDKVIWLMRATVRQRGQKPTSHFKPASLDIGNGLGEMVRRGSLNCPLAVNDRGDVRRF